MRFLDRLQPLALLVLRLVLAVVMIAYGYPKLFMFSKQVQSVSALGLPGWLAYFSIAAEFLGGLAVLFGLFTRLAALGILIDMLVAIGKVHWHHGLKGPGGYQFAMAMAAIAFSLIFFGAGPISLDAVLGRGGGGKKS